MQNNYLKQWAHVAAPKASGQMKLELEDFCVDEILGFELSGEGEHIFLHIEKRGLNTQDVIKILASKFALHPKHIAYSGLKDKQAVTRQWLSVWSPKELHSDTLETEGFKVLTQKRHISKLKRGAHRANSFEIIIRHLKHSEQIEKTIERIRLNGVPNYFGPQRFGRGGKNLDKARDLFERIHTLGKRVKLDRQQRSIYLSAARSFLFNEVLSTRVKQENWDSVLSGEAIMLAGSNSYFTSKSLAVEEEQALPNRLAEFDIHPSAPLWGKGDLATVEEALTLETDALKTHLALQQGLEVMGLKQQRRATRLIAEDLTHEFLADDVLKLRFNLVKGTFATSVLRELVTITL